MTSTGESRPADGELFPLLGMDISEKRIGLAIAEHPAVMPQPLFTYPRETRARDLARCEEWVRRYDIKGIVIGLPVNMDGTQGPRAKWMQRFAEELRRRVSVPVLLQDERLTTIEAEDMLQAHGLRPDERAERVDAVAASLILQRFLNER